MLLSKSGLPLRLNPLEPMFVCVSLSRFLFAVLALALTFAPLPGGGAATAMPSAGSMEHCEDMRAPPKDQTDREASCCVAACVGMPAIAAAVAEPALKPAPMRHPALPANASGLDPEAETPPPRNF